MKRETRRNAAKYTTIALMLILCVGLTGCSSASVSGGGNRADGGAAGAAGGNDSTDASGTSAASGAGSVTGEVVITLDYVRQPGSASNQYAVWIEDMQGNLIKSLYASRWTANGGYSSRPDSIPLWVAKAGLSSMAKSEVDAVSSATPGTGPASHTWDLTDLDGAKVQAGDYTFFVEGTLRWKNFVLYSGVITVRSAPTVTEAEAAYTYMASDRQPALTSDSSEIAMIANVAARFTP